MPLEAYFIQTQKIKTVNCYKQNLDQKKDYHAHFIFKVPLHRNIAASTHTWHDNLVTGYTLGGEFITVAVIAEQCIILASEGFICQRAIAAEATEAVLMVMPVFIKEFLAAEQRKGKDTESQFIHLQMCPRNEVTFPGI